MPDVGITALDVSGKWMGGRYYLQHLVRCVRAMAPEIALYDIYWTALPETDPFAEVRGQLTGRRVFSFPETTVGRIVRKAKRTLRSISDARDLFEGIDVTFPIPLIENQGIPYIFWMPDLQHEHLRPLYKEEHYAHIVAEYTKYVRGARRIIVSSAFGLNDFARFYPEQAPIAHVLRFCSIPAEEWWSVEPRAFCASIGLDGKFFVLSNQFTEHKNHLTVVEAVRLLRDRGTNVVVACTGSDYDFRGMNYFGRVQEYVRQHGLESQVRFLGLLPRREQLAVTRGAVAALQPSRFEGWSTVIEDAKSLGKPVIASEFPVHREQLEGRAATFVGMDDAEGWARALAVLAASREPGPHPEEESAAQPRIEAAMRDCAQTFAAIVRKSLESER
jgi:glycosyltransferase involved in cell wall biosynthesis